LLSSSHRQVPASQHADPPRRTVPGWVVGVIGNEIAALIRWGAARRLDSPARIADGHHARADGYVSAGIIVSAAFIALGLPITVPIIASSSPASSCGRRGSPGQPSAVPEHQARIRNIHSCLRVQAVNQNLGQCVLDDGSLASGKEDLERNSSSPRSAFQPTGDGGAGVCQSSVQILDMLG